MAAPTKTIVTIVVLVAGAVALFFRDQLLTEENPAVRAIATTIESIVEPQAPAVDEPGDSGSLPVLALESEPKIVALRDAPVSVRAQTKIVQPNMTAKAVVATAQSSIEPPAGTAQGVTKEIVSPPITDTIPLAVESRPTALLTRPSHSAVTPLPPAETDLYERPDPVGEIPALPLPSVPVKPVIDLAVKREATRFIRNITKPIAAPLPATKIDHFVTADQVIELPEQPMIEISSARQLLNDPALSPSSLITVVKQAEHIVRVSPRDLIASAQGNLDTPIKVLDKETVRETTVRHLLQTAGKNPQRRLKIIQSVDYFVVTTVQEVVQEQGSQQISRIRVIKGPYVADKLAVTDLIPQRPGDGLDHIYYVRTVRDNDIQGIWGIIHSGLVDNFARGMAIRHGKKVDTYRVEIPRLADELEVDRSSSYLGKLLTRKVRASHVYNHRKRRMGVNPDRVFPGQEIVIVDFSSDELISVYQHFLRAGNSG